VSWQILSHYQKPGWTRLIGYNCASRSFGATYLYMELATRVPPTTNVGQKLTDGIITQFILHVANFGCLFLSYIIVRTHFSVVLHFMFSTWLSVFQQLTLPNIKS
jgi:hypothetical protein